ncbi:hypothetical protein M2284_003649 [Rhodococcus sp. LBL1]|uniref:Uncharacterized protein n=1 Tax=Prescottella agglutinans TaxID=1644129 RepID=A0ABT6M6G4_9NOCA|nr:hypothetical protein [Prescottella agglutinans]MDH6279901.1 hypothetical protein [Prescottella agglutinans]MDH6679427.1 hypothetical protein [Rhodococcus sp. LBL1]MDH6685434.1 hypothetical protein [Rhodococcus sp. LBL2]
MNILGPNDDLERMFRWFADAPSCRVDFDRTHGLVPDVETLWLARRGDFG